MFNTTWILLQPHGLFISQGQRATSFHETSLSPPGCLKIEGCFRFPSVLAFEITQGPDLVQPRLTPERLSLNLGAAQEMDNTRYSWPDLHQESPQGSIFSDDFGKKSLMLAPSGQLKRIRNMNFPSYSHSWTKFEGDDSCGGRSPLAKMSGSCTHRMV